jgi:hypothetical protein
MSSGFIMVVRSPVVSYTVPKQRGPVKRRLQKKPFRPTGPQPIRLKLKFVSSASQPQRPSDSGYLHIAISIVLIQ